MIKSVIFDFDGVIYNSKKVCVDAFKRAYAEICQREGVTPLEYDDEHIASTIIGPKTKIGYSKLITENMIQHLDEIVKVGIEYEFQFAEQGVSSFYEGVIEVLDVLKEKGIDLFIVTNSVARYVNGAFNSNNVDKSLFKEIFLDDGTNKVERVKRCIGRYNLTPNDTFVVGDRKDDNIMSRENNCRFIGVTYGFGNIEEFKGSEFIINNLNEIINIIDKENS